MEQEYYIGLDIGTSSVGWAVTDMNYQIIKRHGRDWITSIVQGGWLKTWRNWRKLFWTDNTICKNSSKHTAY